MKAISLWQPWASLIAEGIKTSETRSWAPPAALVGERIAFHAAKRPITKLDILVSWGDELRAAACALVGAENPYNRRYFKRGLPYGAVVATARLVAWERVWYDDGERVRTDASLAADPNRWKYGRHAPDGLGDYSPGRWIWFLDDIKKLDPPIPAIGRQRVWNWEPPEGFADG